MYVDIKRFVLVIESYLTQWIDVLIIPLDFILITIIDVREINKQTCMIPEQILLIIDLE